MVFLINPTDEVDGVGVGVHSVGEPSGGEPSGGNPFAGDSSRQGKAAATQPPHSPNRVRRDGAHHTPNLGGASDAACADSSQVDERANRKRSRAELKPVVAAEDPWESGSPGVGVNDLFQG